MSGSQIPHKKAKLEGKTSGGGRAGQGGSNTAKECYLHVVTDAQATSLAGSGSQCPIEDIKKKSGADVQLDPCTSSVQGTKTVIIKGSRSQIEEAVRLINQETGDQETISAQAQSFWVKWVEAAFPDLDSRAYFLPPVYFNRVPMTRHQIADQDVVVFKEKGQSNQPSSQSSSQTAIPQSTGAQASILQPACVQDSDVRDDAAMQRVLVCLQTLFEQNKEVLVGLTQLLFGQYLGEPCYAAAAAHLRLPANLPPALPQKWKQGDFDVLLIHRQYGLVTCEVMAFGDNIQELKMSQQDVDNTIRKKLSNAVSQLDKAEAMLSHLVSDIAPGLRITKTIAFPNLTTRQVQQAISGDSKFSRDLSQCLKTSDPADIPGLCLCCDQLSDRKTLPDVSSHVLSALGHWWQRRVAGAGPDSHMTPEVYKTLVAR
ncbi:uncharacterized protein LOC112576054 [Pomacea canaliculata]|uniref:uncharacterized protein LOC112576054 n=1 Tax=Pomacea canaliculata TaxID=400727 RepID=UPI000D72D9B9|nr:uncharacterized protein LOC112576054 [Pomacea canaliculata]